MARPSVTTAVQLRESSRVTGLDAARVLATLGIVWVHVFEIQGQAESLATLGRFGTSFYILAALFLSSRAFFLGRKVNAKRLIRRRAQRLLVPYVLWCALYAVFYFCTMYPQGYTVKEITSHWGPIFGTAPHLWFLPFAFLAGALATYAVPRMMKLPGWFLIAGGGLITLALYVFVYGWAYPALDQPALAAAHVHRLVRWTEETPFLCGALFGMAIYGRYIKRLARIGRATRMQIAWLAFAAFLLIEAAYALFFDDLGRIFWNQVRFFANLAGAAWLITFVAARDGKWIRKIAPLGRATYFAYLSHQMILDMLKRLLSHFPGYGSFGFAVFSSLLIYGLAVGTGLLVPRVRQLRWLSP